MEPIQDDIETPYEPFDQDKWLTKPWRFDRADVVAWEAAHGHDARSKCYVEFGCQVIEPTLERRIDRLVAERDEAREERELWRNQSIALEAERDRLSDEKAVWEAAFVEMRKDRDRLKREHRLCVRRIHQLERGIQSFLDAEKAGEMGNVQKAIEHLERLMAQI
jgi:hypothetical protein